MTTALEPIKGEKLIAVITQIAAQGSAEPVVQKARTVADSVTDGILITTAAEAQAATAIANEISAGITLLTKWRAECKAVTKAMDAAIMAATNVAGLEEKKAILGKAYTAYTIEQERLATAARLAEHQAAREVVEEVRASGEDDAMPDVYVPVQQVATVTRTEAGTAHIQRVLKIEVVDMAEAAKHYPHIFDLRLADAKLCWKKYLRDNRLNEDDYKTRAGEKRHFNGLTAEYVPDARFKKGA